MAQQPSVVIIARHGARIDQADRAWRTNNATNAFNPPLTYGGWIQCQMLGNRIAAELNSLDGMVGGKSTDDLTSPPPRKKRRIIVHSSPYLRCVQTSVAIGAGLRQNQQPHRPSLRPQRSSLSRPPQVNDSPVIPEDNEPAPRSVPPARPSSPPSSDAGRAKMRLDSFLGEWLSPSYFEDQVRPPPSEELVQSAKEYLRAPAEDIKGADLSSPPIQDLAAIDWETKEKEATAAPAQEKTGLRAMAAAGHAMAKRPRNFSFETGPNGRTQVQKTTRRLPITYNPPVPTYSIAPQDAIPIGFVAHARDACLDVDFTWDSQQPPLEWGDGGIYDEEWAGMHRRFRNGLEKMLTYYGDLADDEQTILILVTHQAGCNALIRLMTGAPALHDVGTASLTMAVRKAPKTELSPVRRTSSHRRGSLDIGIADNYDMKIIASTEHLRGGSNPLGLNSPRLGKSPAFASKRAAGPDSPEGFSIGESISWRPSSGHGLARSHSQRSYAVDETAAPPNGLWGQFQGQRSDSVTSSDAKAFAVNELGSATASISDDKSEAPSDGGDSMWGGQSGSGHLTPEMNAVSSLPVRSASQRGLWGGESSINRSRSPGKRRWTAVERSP